MGRPLEHAVGQGSKAEVETWETQRMHKLHTRKNAAWRAQGGEWWKDGRSWGVHREPSLSARDHIETRSKRLGQSYGRGLDGVLETGVPCQPATEMKRLFQLAQLFPS